MPITDGVIDGVGGRYAHQQPFPGGVNVYGLVEGTERPDEIVVVGAHDQARHVREAVGPDDDAVRDVTPTDNATGARRVSWSGRSSRFAELTTGPPRCCSAPSGTRRRTALAGLAAYANHPVVPSTTRRGPRWFASRPGRGPTCPARLGQRSGTFAVGAETGGAALVVTSSATAAAGGDHTLDTTRLSLIFGANRSDHVPFVERQVPIVFFSDSTGGCYHGPDDESDVVDFTKLGRQQRVIRSTVDALAAGTVTPTFTSAPPATFDDLLGLLAVVERAENDSSDLRRRHARVSRPTGRRSAPSATRPNCAWRRRPPHRAPFIAAAFVERLGELPCDGFLPD